MQVLVTVLWVILLHLAIGVVQLELAAIAPDGSFFAPASGGFLQGGMVLCARQATLLLQGLEETCVQAALCLVPAQVAAALRSSPTNLAIVQQGRGLRRISHLLQWASLAFPAPSPQPPAAEHLPALPALATRPPQGAPPHAHFPGSPRTLLHPQEPDQATPASLPSDGSWEPPSPHPAPPGTPGRRSRLGGSLAEPVTSPTPPVPPWADGSSSPFAGRLSTGSLERMSPRLRSLPEQRRRATDSDETLMQQHRQRSLMRRSSAGGGGLPAGGFAAAAPDKRSSLRQLLSGRGEAGEQLHASGGSQRQGRMPSLASAPASQEASTGAQQLEAPPMGPLAQAGLPALPSPPLGEAFAVLEAWLGLAQRQPPWGVPRQHWDRCGPLASSLSFPHFSRQLTQHSALP